MDKSLHLYVMYIIYIQLYFVLCIQHHMFKHKQTICFLFDEGMDRNAPNKLVHAFLKMYFKIICYAYAYRPSL